MYAYIYMYMYMYMYVHVQVSILYHMHTVCSYSNTLKHMYVVLMFFYIIQLFHIYVCMYVCM
jgi:hypothetical protein